MIRLCHLRLAIPLGAGWFCAFHATAFSADVDFYRDVYPTLKANCISCHNKTTTKADLNMETPELMKKGGESGPGVIPGKSADSLVMQAAAHIGDSEMPPKNNKTGAKNFTVAELAVLKTWIDQGAKSSVQQARQVVWQPLPPGVNPIYTVAMTKDGRFAACGRANQIFLYDLATRQVVTRVAAPDGVAHRALVQSLAFSPDGSRLASASFREVKIWRQEKPKAISRPATAALISILSGDGKQIICSDKQGALQVLDAATGKITKSLPAVTTATIKLLAVTPDASKLALYGADASLHVLSLPDGRTIATQTGITGARALTWSRDGATLAVAGEDKILRVWPLSAMVQTPPAPPQELKGASGILNALAATANPDQLLGASEDGKVRLWSISGGKVLKEFPIAGVTALASSRDGKQFASAAADGTVRLWDIETAKPAGELRGDVESGKRMASLDWIADAQGLELAFQTKEVARIETENKALEELLKKANETIASVKKVLPEKQKAVKPVTDEKLAAQKAADAVAALIAKSPEAKAAAELEKQNKEAQDKLMAATMAESTALASVEASEHHIADAEAEVKHITAAKTRNGAAIQTANVAMAAAKQAQSKAAADLATAKLAAAKGSTRTLALAFSSDAQTIAALGSDGVLRVWATASGMPTAQTSVSAAATSGSLAVSLEGDFITCNATGAVASTGAAPHWVLERTLGGSAAGSPLADRVNAVRFSPDGKTLAVGGGEPSRSGDISLWDVASGRPLKIWNECHSDAVLSLDFSPDGKLLASGGADKIARVTDIATGKPARVFEGHTHHVMGVAFRADGRELATAGGDGVVLVWDMIVGERKKKIEGWTKEVTSLQFIGATPQILTSAGDNLVRIVSDEGSEVRAMAKLPDFMQSAASGATGSVIVGGGEDSILRVWDGTNGKELAVFGMK